MVLTFKTLIGFVVGVLLGILCGVSVWSSGVLPEESTTPVVVQQIYWGGTVLLMGVLSAVAARKHWKE